MKENLSKKIKRNVLSLTFGRTLSLLINFFSITIAARFLGVNDFGLFASLLALVFILSKIVDFGFVPIVYRELSKHSNDFLLLNNALTLRLIILMCVLISFDVYSLVFKIGENEIFLSNIFFINIIISGRFYNFRELLEIPFKVNYDAHIIMNVNIIDNLVLLLSVLFLPLFKNKLDYFVIIYCMSNLPGFLSILIFLNKKYSYHLRLTLQNSKWLLREAFPLLGFVILNALFLQIDILILKYFDTEYAVGLYSAATRLTMPLSIIPLAIISSLYPLIVQKVKSLDVDERNDSINMYKLIHKILFLLSFGSTIIVSFKSKEIIVLLFGIQFQDAWISLILLFCAYIFLFYNFFSLDLLTAFNKQKHNFFYSVIIVLVNILFSFLLIWKFSLNGIALSKLLASIVGSAFLAVTYYFLKIRINFINRTLIVWSLCALTTTWLISYLNIVVYTILIPVIILLLVLKLHFFNNEELLVIMKLSQSKMLNKLFLKLGSKRI